MRVLVLLLVCLNTYIFSQSFDEFISKLDSSPVEQRKTIVNEFLSKKGTTPIIENDTLIHFIWFGKANKVLIAGDLQHGWAEQDTLIKVNCGEENLFYKTYTIPSDSRLNYVFIADGQYGLDLKNPRTAPTAYGPNSEAVMPKFVTNPIVNFRADIAHGTLDSLTFKSKEDSLKPRQIKIYLPAGYENLSDLPSIYINDGFDALNIAGYKNVLDNLIADKAISPVVAVFIQPVQRMDEFIGGKRRLMSDAICNELIPLIDGKYKTSKEASKRAMMGTSYSGNITYATVLERTDLFLNVAAQSIIEGELYGLLASESEKRVFPKELKAYIDYGIFEYNGEQGNLVNGIRFLSGCINSYGIKHTFVENHDGHNWYNWRQNTDRILKLFFGI